MSTPHAAPESMMTPPRTSPTRREGRHRRAGRRLVITQTAVLTTLFALTGVMSAPGASADSAESLRAAVAAARSSACSPMQSNPTIDQAAHEINQSTDRWINNAARSAPDTDALPILKDLGYGGSKARILSGAARTDGDAIKATLLQGWADLPDCSYTEFGVDALYNAKKDMILTTVVLAA
jgi:hypothetical protein